MRTTTDNGSNFLKAFQVYGAALDMNNNIRGDPEPDDDREEEEGGEEEVEFVQVADILDENDGFELNLVSTVDAEKATSNDGYKRVYRSAFGKCQGLWNKCGRSVKAAEAVEEACSVQLLRPIATRWNSLFMAVERLLKILEKRAICTEFHVPM